MTVMSLILDLPMPALIVLIAIFGLVVGSFLNVVIVRLPEIMSRSDKIAVLQYNEQSIPDDLLGKYNLLTPASHCPQCKSPVRWWMNVPVFSYLTLRGRCAGCAKSISLQYPLVEVACALAAALAIFKFGANYPALAIIGLLWALITLTVIDLNTQLLPDIITLPLMWAGLLVNSQGMVVTLNAAVWGAAAGYMSLWAVFHAFKALTGKDGMGYGDFKLLAALGAWLGITMILPILLFASFTGALIGLSLIATGKRELSDKIPFGPYLAGGGVLALWFGPSLVQTYLGLFA